MSMCAVHMMKMKMSAMGGIQSHNQREHESKKNREIDYEKSDKNYDLLLDEKINYQRAVKERIAELDLKKAVRKDAVVYCSFIVSSDREFFEGLGLEEHIRRERQTRENVKIGVEEPSPFEYLSDEYREDCIRVGSEKFFAHATEFFCQRYGAENVTNATVHLDEATPHMHLGVIPVTADGRLSAKDIFTPVELKQLQTDFAEEVGKRFQLERGREGSEAKHLDELSFKVQKRQEQLEKLEESVWEFESRERELQSRCKDLEEHAESLSKAVSDLEADISTLNTQKSLLERMLARLEEYKDELKRAIDKLTQKFVGGSGKKEEIDLEIRKEKAISFIERMGQKEQFEQFCEAPQKAFHNPFIQEQKKGQEKSR